MKNNKDIRWQQRFNNLKKAFDQLERFIRAEDLNEMEKQGLIKAFEYTYELSWKTLQDLLKDKGYLDVAGPKPVIRQSFQDGYLRQGQAWMGMIDSRNLSTHTYDESTAEELTSKIKSLYYYLFEDLISKLEEEKSGHQESLFDE